ncbi:hypothetical protein PPROV_001047500 [Pycnococcus provasolii]|uniref:CCT domain-containing protein n=1 Tax=Pycnococcus provasolii TaxID=41880 RepID=A0A830I3L9_9CHLO|nr:hypothetical protein PPROV_001047500 [Pycnococcus provasolii]
MQAATQAAQPVQPVRPVASPPTPVTAAVAALVPSIATTSPWSKAPSGVASPPRPVVTVPMSSAAPTPARSTAPPAPAPPPPQPPPHLLAPTSQAATIAAAAAAEAETAAATAAALNASPLTICYQSETWTFDNITPQHVMAVMNVLHLPPWADPGAAAVAAMSQVAAQQFAQAQIVNAAVHQPLPANPLVTTAPSALVTAPNAMQVDGATNTAKVQPDGPASASGGLPNTAGAVAEKSAPVNEAAEKRRASLERFREKRQNRNFEKRVRYEVRKEVALRMARNKGQFTAAPKAETPANGAAVATPATPIEDALAPAIQADPGARSTAAPFDVANLYNKEGAGKHGDEERCLHCATPASLTPMMRRGPTGPRTLCNACGLFWKAKGELRPLGTRPPAGAPAPATVAHAPAPTQAATDDLGDNKEVGANVVSDAKTPGVVLEAPPQRTPEDGLAQAPT